MVSHGIPESNWTDATSCLHAFSAVKVTNLRSWSNRTEPAKQWKEITVLHQTLVRSCLGYCIPFWIQTEHGYISAIPAEDHLNVHDTEAHTCARDWGSWLVQPKEAWGWEEPSSTVSLRTAYHRLPREVVEFSALEIFKTCVHKALIWMVFFHNWPSFEKQPDARFLLPQVPFNLKSAKILRHWNDFGRKHAYNIYSWNIQLSAFLRHIWTPIVLLVFFPDSEFSCHGNICLRGSLQWYSHFYRLKAATTFFQWFM